MKAVQTYRLRLGGAILIGTVSTVCAMAAAVSASVLSLEVPVISALAIVTEPRAARSAEGDNGQQAIQANRRVFASAPMTASAWLRIPYLQSRTGEPLDAAGLKALDNSYAVAPFGPDVTRWRLRFIFEHWSEMTPTLREQALAELQVLLTNRGNRAFDPAEIENPAGRLAATLTREHVIARRVP